MKPYHVLNEVQIENLKREAANKLGCNINSVEYITWNQTFPNTAGPRSSPGIVSGQAFTAFEIFGFKNGENDLKIKVCPGKSFWSLWNGEDTDKAWIELK